MPLPGRKVDLIRLHLICRKNNDIPMKIVHTIIVLAALVWVSTVTMEQACADGIEAVAEATSEEVLAAKLNDLAKAPLTSKNFQDARRYVQAAAKSENKQHAASLKSIIDARAPTKWHLLAFDALYSLWLLGEPKVYFLANAKTYADNPTLASYSILILAYDPIPDVTEELPSKTLGNIGKVPLAPEAKEIIRSKNLVNSALSSYGLVNLRLQEYLDTSEPEKRMEILVSCIRSKWNPIGVDEHDPTENLAPQVVWARTRLFKLSQEQPSLVARSICALRPTVVIGNPEVETKAPIVKEYQAFFLRGVGEQAKREYEALQNGDAGSK